MYLESERLQYNKMVAEDFSNYTQWYMNDAVMKYITGRALNLEETKIRFAKALETNEKYPEMGLFSVTKKDDGSFIGIAKLTYVEGAQAEVGYGMLPAYWGLGYASEILENMLIYAKTLKTIDEVIAIIDPHNAASKNVLRKQGFNFLSSGEENFRPAEHYVLKLRNKVNSNNQ